MTDERIRDEIRHAIDTGGVTMTELLAPGSLTMTPDPEADVIRLWADGVQVGTIPCAVFRQRVEEG